MSKFRAINQPSQSPPKPASGKRLLYDIISQHTRETDKGQTPGLTQAALVTSKAKTAKNEEFPAVIIPVREIQLSPKEHPGQQVQSSTARPGAAVAPPDDQSSSQSKGKEDIRQRFAKAKQAMRTPGKKNDKSKSSTLKARRRQFPREKKLMPSIEHLALKRRLSSTDSSINAAAESDYIPSSPATSRTSVTKTPSQRSHRRQPSTCPDVGSSGLTYTSPQTEDTPVVIKREMTTAPKTISTPSPASPSIWSSPLRAKRYEDAEFVELPEEVFEYERTEKEMLQQLRIKKEAVIAGKRKEKGKFAERRDKRKAEEEAEQPKSHKRQKSQKPGLEGQSEKSQKPGLQGQSVTDGPKAASIEPQASQQTDARRSPRSKTQKRQAQRYRAVTIKAEDRSDITDVRSQAGIKAKSRSSEASQDVQRSFESQMPVEQASRRREHGGPLSEGGRRPHERREVYMPKAPRPCSCVLPEYFTSNPNRVPSRKTWPGGRLEFFEHVKQISCCRGSIHPPKVVNACRVMLRKANYPNRGDEEPLESMFEYDNGFPSNKDQDDGQLGRAQSSIPPATFYGFGDSYRPAANARNLSRSRPRTKENRQFVDESPGLKDFPTRSTPRKTLVMCKRIKSTTHPMSPSVDQHPRSAVVGDANGFPTPPDSSPLGKRYKVHVPSYPMLDESPQAGGSVSVTRPSKGSRETSRGCPKPPASFSAPRNRHQSEPFNLHRTPYSVNDHDLSPQPRQTRRGNPLQEISSNIPHISTNDIQGLVRKIDTVLERLPGPVIPAPTGAVQQATALTVATTVGEGNSAQQANPMKRKRPSAAERREKQPELSSDVPVHLRKSDKQIIKIGREIANAYKRHKSAPEAFGYSGLLRTEKDYLLEKVENGARVWTAKQIRRLTR